LKQKASAIFQYGDRWYGLEFEVQKKSLENFTFYTDKGLDELKDICRNSICGISLGSSSGYIVGFRFPFSGSRKIAMVIDAEMEELLPFPMDDMVVDFEEFGGGNVLAAAVPKTLVDPADWGKQVRSITLNAVAAAYGLRWFQGTPHHRYVVVYTEGGTAVMMAYNEGTLHTVRQFFHAGEAPVVREAIKGMRDDPLFLPEAYYLIGDDGDGAGLFMEVAKELNIRIEVPSLKRFMKVEEETPQFFWTGIGSALLALSPGKGINFLGGARSGFTLANKAILYATGALAGISVIVAGISYIDLVLQSRTYRYLGDEQTRIYREVFPNAPPVKDIGKMFEDKIMAIDREATVSGPNTGLSPLGILAEMSGKIDTQIDVKLSEYTWDETEFSITGTTVSYAAAEKIKTALEQMHGVKKIEIQNLDLSAGRQVNLKMRGKL
jgi:hypothetical protein